MGLSKLICLKKVLQLGINFGRASVSSRNYSDDHHGANACGGHEGATGGSQVTSDGSKKGLVLGVYEEKGKLELSPAAQELDQKSEGKISRHLNELSCEMHLGKAFAVTDVVPEYSVVALASMGPKDAGYNKLEELDEARENVRWGVGAGVSLLRARGCGHIDVDGASIPDAAAEAAHLAAWSFSEFKSVQQPAADLALYGKDDAEQWAEGTILGGAQNWARYLSDMPANRMTPVDLAQAALDTLCPLGISVTVRDLAWLRAQNMEGVLTVSRGSCETPVLLECHYHAADTQPVLLAAKGVTFDSGGLCLKPAPLMEENRGSMAGAAVTLAALKALAELKVYISQLNIFM
ncbi:cytosol aminopeptidase-like [Epargyreus clarus]|uniref:cytosol aminopeptidase-like n=1 Tax=Epargyreus clarus TaxID=520877 RepID=UPI003C301C03